MLEGFGLRKVSSGEGYNKISTDVESANLKITQENNHKSAVMNQRRKVLVRVMMFGLAITLFRFVYVFSQDGGSCVDGDGNRGLCFLYASQELTEAPLYEAGQGLKPSSYSAHYLHLRSNESADSVSASKDFRLRVRSFSTLFQKLMEEGIFRNDAKALFYAPKGAQEEMLLAMKEIGVSEDVAFGMSTSSTYDFVLWNDFDCSENSAEEIFKALKPGGFALVRARPNPNMYSINTDSLILFFRKKFRLVRSNVNNEGFAEIILKKDATSCDYEKYKEEAVSKAEDLIEEEPLKPWLTLKRNIKNIKYMPRVADIEGKRKYVYVDVGARSYGSSIGGWFRKSYPQMGKEFDVYAIEADPAFHGDYVKRKGVKLLPYAAWVKNESLSFEINRDKGSSLESKGMGRIQPLGSGNNLEKFNRSVLAVQGIDFAEWLKNTVSAEDFVVMKMDVEGTEFELLPRMIESGTICLVDELFLECHYNRWQRSSPERTRKYKHTYSQCLDIFKSLRSMGILAHQWW